MKTLLCAITVLLMNIQFAQDIGTVNLSLTKQESASSIDEAETVLHSGCSEFFGGTIGEDSHLLPLYDNEPRKLLVDFTRVPSDSLLLGSTVDAEVRITNMDTRPIVIPWSTNLSIIPKNQDPAHAEWEVGSFWFSLSDKRQHRILLKSLSRYLYGTKSAPGTELVIHPGENIRAVVQFKVEAMYPDSSPQLKHHKRKLGVEWQQYGLSSSFNECRKFVGFTDGRFAYYHEETPRVPIQIVSVAPPESEEAAR